MPIKVNKIPVALWNANTQGDHPDLRRLKVREEAQSILTAWKTTTQNPK